MSQYEKWFERAEEFERLLLYEGLASARAFMKRYHHKRRLLLDAIWEVFVVKETEEKG